MKFITERVLKVWDEEDAGRVRIAHFEPDTDDPDRGLYLRLCSYDEKRDHFEWEMLRGKKVRITVETVD